jgi:hypothetical protein
MQAIDIKYTREFLAGDTVGLSPEQIKQHPRVLYGTQPSSRGAFVFLLQLINRVCQGLLVRLDIPPDVVIALVSRGLARRLLNTGGIP